MIHYSKVALVIYSNYFFKKKVLAKILGKTLQDKETRNTKHYLVNPLCTPQKKIKNKEQVTIISNPNSPVEKRKESSETAPYAKQALGPLKISPVRESFPFKSNSK